MGKKVISFSLYGKRPMYTLGAVANARHANRTYPGWVCRFYVTDDVPEGIIVRLKDYGAEVINMGPHLSYEPLLWRFFATVDPEVDIALLRDADSRFTKCELLMVNEWLASDKKFHVMHPGPYYLPIQAGLWGVRGNIPNFKELIENHQRSGSRKTDEWFLRDSLYPQMKGKVFVHEHEHGSQVKRRYFVGETIHPFPAIALNIRGRYLNSGFYSGPVGLKLPERRKFFAFSIYKRTIFSEFFLTLLLRLMEKKSIFNRKQVRFYVADNISPSLIERLRPHGRVILKPAKTVHKDDPQYWKLLILSEKNIEWAVIVDFWQFFFLESARLENNKIYLYELLPIEHGLSSGIRSGFTRIPVLSVCDPDHQIFDIENLIARRDPNENYREFIRSTVYPRTSTTRMMSILRGPGRSGFIWGLARILFPSWLYEFARYSRKYIP